MRALPDRSHYNGGVATTGLITTEQFLAMPEQYDASGNRIKSELIAGEIVFVAFASRLHDLVKNRIGELLLLFLAPRPSLGLRSLIEIGYDVSDQDAFAPDVSVIERSRLLEGSSRIVTGAPEIAIEVVSPTDTAIRLKHRIGAYLANGARSVWIVYPEERSVEIHTARGVREFTGDQPVEDETLPGFSHSAAGFFEGL